MLSVTLYAYAGNKNNTKSWKSVPTQSLYDGIPHVMVFHVIFTMHYTYILIVLHFIYDIL